MSKIIKMETPVRISKGQKLLALFQAMLERAKTKMLDMQKPPAVPSKYTLLTFLKAVVSDLVTIATVVVVGGIVGAGAVVVVLYTLIENSIILIVRRYLKAQRKTNFKLKKV